MILEKSWWSFLVVVVAIVIVIFTFIVLVIAVVIALVYYIPAAAASNFFRFFTQCLKQAHEREIQVLPSGPSDSVSDPPAHRSGLQPFFCFFLLLQKDN